MTQIQQTDEVFIKTLKLLNKKFPGVDLTRPSFIGLVFLTAEKSLAITPTQTADVQTPPPNPFGELNLRF